MVTIREIGVVVPHHPLVGQDRFDNFYRLTSLLVEDAVEDVLGNGLPSAQSARRTHEEVAGAARQFVTRQGRRRPVGRVPRQPSRSQVG